MSNNSSFCEMMYGTVHTIVEGQLVKAINLSADPCIKGPCSALHMCQQFSIKFALPLRGYLSPLLVILTVINNSLVSIVLLKKNMRSPTNNLLVSMAIADTLTGVCAMPISIHFFSSGNYKDYVPFNWCQVIEDVGIHLPTIFHTASIWLTVGLAVQRYIYVCHSFLAKTVCTTKNVVIGTGIVYVISTLVHFARFFEHHFQPIRVVSLIDSSKQIESCLTRRNQWLIDVNPHIYYNIYFWFRVIFIHLIPCTSLIVLNTLLILAMKKAGKRRKLLLRQNRRSESKRLKDSNCTTLMLIAVVGLFLLVELPLGIVILLHIIQNTFPFQIIPGDVLMDLMVFMNFSILLSYPLNFFIYCGMSRHFRQNFKNLFIKSVAEDQDGYSHYPTMQTENGKTLLITGETAL